MFTGTPACLQIQQRLQSSMRANRFWHGKNSIVGCRLLPHIFLIEGGRFAGHCVLCTAQETKSNNILAFVPPHRHGSAHMECNQILSRRPFHFHGFLELNRPRCHVWILPGVGVQSRIQE